MKMKPRIVDGEDVSSCLQEKTMEPRLRLYTQQIQLIKKCSLTDPFECEDSVHEESPTLSIKMKASSTYGSYKQSQTIDSSCQGSRSPGRIRSPNKSPERRSVTFKRLLSISSQEMFEELTESEQLRETEKNIKNELRSLKKFGSVAEWSLKNVQEHPLFSLFFLEGKSYSG